MSNALTGTYNSGMTDFIPPDSFAGLTPELVLDAVESSGLRSDGRMLALNSYENRVYQIGIEDASPIIAKFYRPLRWSDEAIQEEHDFVTELQAHEIPVLAALQADNGNSLRHYQGFRFSLFKRQSGRAPETGDPATLEWLGRFIGRIHAVGATASYAVRPALNSQSFGVLPRAWLLEHDFIPPDLLAAYTCVSQQALDGIRACYDIAPLYGAMDRGRISAACRGNPSTDWFCPYLCETIFAEFSRLYRGRRGRRRRSHAQR